MIGVLLKFDVKEGMEEKFVKAWEDTTKAIYRSHGSLGSRLHKTESGVYMAYAQWPSLEVYDSDHLWSQSDQEIREEMRSTLIGGRPVLIEKLEIVSDLLKSQPNAISS